MKPSLIIVPTGGPVPFAPNLFSDQSHWRHVGNERNYEVHVYNYNNYDIEPGTYDHITYKQGLKWQIVRDAVQSVDYQQYEYIGFWDDDVVTSNDSLNTAITTAFSAGAKVWQMSTYKDGAGFGGLYHLLVNRPNVNYTVVPHVEGQCPFVHSSLIPMFRKYIDFWKPTYGWGFDVTLAAALGVQPMCIHKTWMFHKRSGPTRYDVDASVDEYCKIIDGFGDWMKYAYDVDVDINQPTTFKPYKGTAKQTVIDGRIKPRQMYHVQLGLGTLLHDTIVFNQNGIPTTVDVNFSGSVKTVKFVHLLDPRYYQMVKKVIPNVGL
jgi:hypothetical protein